MTRAGALCCLAAITLIGCSSTTRTMTDLDGPLVEEQILPPGEAVEARDLMLREQGDWVYESVDDGRTRTHRFAVDFTTRNDADFVIREDARRAEFIKEGSDGSFLLTAVAEREHNTVSHFDPPLLAAPAELAAGEPIEVQSSMRVVDGQTGTKERERGTATQRIEYVGDQMVTTPRGAVRAKRVEFSFLADLRMADATTRTTRWIVPGRGIVLEERVEQISALGIPGGEKVRTLRLVRSPHD